MIISAFPLEMFAGGVAYFPRYKRGCRYFRGACYTLDGDLFGFILFAN